MKNKTIFQIYILSALVYFAQGIEGLPGLAFFLYLKEHLGFSAEKVMYISSIAGIAWLVKPLWGYLCDNYFDKKTWISTSLVGSIAIACYFGLSPILALPLIIVLLSMGSFTAAVRDVAADGVMCVSGKENDNCDKIQAIQWTSITIAGILASLGGGYIAQHFSYKLAYLCLIPFYVVMLLCLNGFRESKSIIVKEKFLVTLQSYRELFTNKTFLVACLFLFLYKYSPGFGTPLMYIERDTFKWSAQFMGLLGAIGSALEIVGAILFFKYCKKINIRKWLIFSVFLGAATTLLYLYFTPISAIAYGILFSSIGMFVHLIIMAFMAQSTIKGKEATSFALLCSISNLAATASTLSGAFLFPKIGLAPLIILSSLTSFICLPLISKLNINKGETNVQTC